MNDATIPPPAPPQEAPPEAAATTARTNPVAAAIAAARQTAEALAAEFPDLADDERAFFDTLDGLTDALDVAERLCKRALARRRLADGCADEIRALQARKARFGRQQEAAEAAAFAILQAACPPDRKGRIRLERPGFTASIAALPASVVITDEAALPGAFIRTKREPDKVAIKAALAAREAALAAAGDDPEARIAVNEQHPPIPGALLSNGGATLRISTR